MLLLVPSLTCCYSSARSSVMKHRIQPGAWKLGQRIGQGSFGEVYVGMDTKRGQLIAVKALVLGSVRLNGQLRLSWR